MCSTKTKHGDGRWPTFIYTPPYLGRNGDACCLPCLPPG